MGGRDFSQYYMPWVWELSGGASPPPGSGPGGPCTPYPREESVVVWEGQRGDTQTPVSLLSHPTLVYIGSATVVSFCHLEKGSIFIIIYIYIYYDSLKAKNIFC